MWDQHPHFPDLKKKKNQSNRSILKNTSSFGTQVVISSSFQYLPYTVLKRETVGKRENRNSAMQCPTYLQFPSSHDCVLWVFYKEALKTGTEPLLPLSRSTGRRQLGLRWNGLISWRATWIKVTNHPGLPGTKSIARMWAVDAKTMKVSGHERQVGDLNHLQWGHALNRANGPRQSIFIWKF